MFIPIGTDRPIRKPTKVVYWLIGINIVVHIAMMSVEARSPGLYARVLESVWLSTPPSVGEGSGATAEGFKRWLTPPGERVKDYSFKPWALVSYQFVHGGMLHLLGNMLFLWVFGPNIEDRFGRWFFLGFYLVGGVFAGLVHLLFGVERPEGWPGAVSWVPPVIGASGSISALTGAYLVLFPKTAVKVLLFFFVIGVFFVPAWVFIAFSIGRDLFLQGLSEVGGASGVAYLAHIGGYAFGAGVSVAALWRGLVRREPYDLFTMGRQAHRRRKFRELTTAQGKRVWSSELADDARVRRRERGERRRAGGESAGGEGELARRRGEIAERVRAGELDEAARAYRELLGAHGEQVVGRDAQLAIANHLGDRGEASEAATAYRLFVERFPKDREADRVRLLLALLNARSLNDPIAASELLERIDRSGLSDEERSVLDALQGEVS